MNKLPFEKIERKILIRKEAETNPEFKADNSVKTLINYGIVNIDKPKGPTSHQVSEYVQRILGINKSGHSGTLDPAVTGVLPIALGRATRIVECLLHAGKEYVALMHLHKEVSEDKIKSVFNEFTGKIKQKPPIKSSVKRVVREREVYYIEILEKDGKDILFRIGCQAGTYIRKICHDIGQSLGCGAHMAELRRTKAGCFDESTLFTLQDLADAYWHYKNDGKEKFIRKVIQPIENAIRHLPKVWVLDTTVESLCHGVDLKVPGIAKVESGIENKDNVAIMTLKNELIALGTAKLKSSEMIGDKGLAIFTEKVFMEPGVYKKAL